MLLIIIVVVAVVVIKRRNKFGNSSYSDNSTPIPMNPISLSVSSPNQTSSPPPSYPKPYTQPPPSNPYAPTSSNNSRSPVSNPNRPANNVQKQALKPLPSPPTGSSFAKGTKVMANFSGDGKPYPACIIFFISLLNLI